MENSTAIFYSDKAWSAHNLGEGIVAHETAHQWFGDAVSQSDWHHVWLSEGFATYARRALDRAHARHRGRSATEMQNNARTVRAAAVRNRPILDTAETRLMALLNANSYPKGELGAALAARDSWATPRSFAGSGPTTRSTATATRSPATSPTS